MVVPMSKHSIMHSHRMPIACKKVLHTCFQKSNLSLLQCLGSQSITVVIVFCLTLQTSLCKRILVFEDSQGSLVGFQALLFCTALSFLVFHHITLTNPVSQLSDTNIINLGSPHPKLWSQN